MTTTDITTTTGEDMHPIVKLMMDDETYQETGDAFSIAASLLAAESADELLSEKTGELTHGKDILGVPFMLHGISFRPGDINPEVPVWAILDVTIGGVEDKISTSALNIMVAAKVAKDKGWLPLMVKMTQGEKTKQGYYPLNLTKATDADLAAEKSAKASAKNQETAKAANF